MSKKRLLNLVKVFFIACKRISIYFWLKSLDTAHTHFHPNFINMM